MNEFTRFKPGDGIPAKFLNQVAEMLADWQQTRRFGADGAQGRREQDTVLVRNESGANRNRCDVLEIDTPFFDPAGTEAEQMDFIKRPVFRAKLPTASVPGRFVVLAEPIGENKIGMAYVSGTFAVRVHVASEMDKTADAIEGEPGMLMSGSGGSAQILWLQPMGDRDPGDPLLAWAMVRMGGTGSTIRRVMITGYGDGGENYFTGVFVNSSGSEDPADQTDFNVYAFRFPADALSTCAPLVGTGDIVPVIPLTISVGGMDEVQWWIPWAFVSTCEP